MSVAHTIARHPWKTLVLVLLLSLLAIGAARNVRLETELVALLPAGSDAADGYRVFLERFGGFERVFVMLLAPADADRDAVGVDLLDAADKLATALLASPEVAAVRLGLDAEDEAFFRDHIAPRAPLLVPDPWRQQVAQRLLPEEIHRRVAWLQRTLTAPAGTLVDWRLTHDPLGFLELLPARPAALSLDPLTSTFMTPQGDAALMVLTPARAEIDPAGGRALESAIDTAFASLRPQLAALPELHAVGGPLYAAHDERLLRGDLERTLATSAIACTVILVAAFAGLLIPLTALLSVAVALLWTAGWLGLGGGSVAAVSLGFAAVLVGLGLDYGIHGGTRFREAFADYPRGEALAQVFRHAGPAIASSALTTAAAFASLWIAHFRPLREVGVLVAVGILAILAASASCGAAVLVLTARPAAIQRRDGILWRALHAAAAASCRTAARWPRRVLAVTAILSLAAVAGLWRLTLDADLRSLRPQDHPSTTAERLLVERFGVGTDTATVVVPGTSLDDALDAAGRVADALRRALGHDVDLSSPGDWLVSHDVANERLRQLATLPLAAAADHLERELRAVNLSPAAFAPGLTALRSMATGRDPAAADPAIWPDWIGAQIRHDSTGAWIALRLRLPARAWPDGPPVPLLQDLQRLAPGTSVASTTAIAAEMRSLARRDLASASSLAAVLVAIVVLLSFRGRLLDAALAVVPVALGALWTLGAWGLLGRPLDLLSLTVLPIVLGIGIDDGLHALHGARHPRDSLDSDSLNRSIIAAGRAMTLTTLTTAVGFGSLMLSRVPGLRHGGLLVAAGVVACLLATLWVLPALGAIYDRREPRPTRSPKASATSRGSMTLPDGR